MLKHSFKAARIFTLAASCILFAGVFLFSGCKSTPAEVEVNPLDLIDNKSQFYFRIPTSVDKVLVKRMIQSSVSDLSDGDAQQIVDRIDNIFVGYTKKRKSSEYQLSASCNFPKVAINKVFTKKNGFKSTKISLNNKETGTSEYEVFSNSLLDISFPSVKTAVLGRNVSDMVNQYHSLYQGLDSNSYASLPASIHEYLDFDGSEGDEQIHFWATNPQSFLTMLTGAHLNLALNYVSGYMMNDKNNSKQFIMQFEFDFKDHRIVPAAKSALGVAFGLTSANSYMTTPTHLVISGIKISKQELYSLFNL